MKKPFALALLASRCSPRSRVLPRPRRELGQLRQMSRADGPATQDRQEVQAEDYTDAAVQSALKDDEMFKAIKEGVTQDARSG